MASKKKAVFGIYSTRVDVERAADMLAKSGFPVTDISVLLPESLCPISRILGKRKSDGRYFYSLRSTIIGSNRAARRARK